MVVKYSTRRVREISRDLEYEINQLISKSIAAEEPVDIFSLIKRDKPDISLLDDNFLEQFKKMEYKNYAADVLFKIINDQIRVRLRKNPYRYRSLYEMLMELIEKYNIRLIDTAEVIQELIEIAKNIRENIEEGKKLGLTEEELTFYDLLSSREGLFENEEEVKRVAKEIVKRLGPWVRVADWNKKERIRAKIRVIVKEILMETSKMNWNYMDNIAGEILSQLEKIYIHS